MSWIVVVGEVVRGYRFIGPFKDCESANDWIEECSEFLDLPADVLAVDLLDPSELKDLILSQNKDAYN